MLDFPWSIAMLVYRSVLRFADSMVETMQKQHVTRNHPKLPLQQIQVMQVHLNLLHDPNNQLACNVSLLR